MHQRLRLARHLPKNDITNIILIFQIIYIFSEFFLKKFYLNFKFREIL